MPESSAGEKVFPATPRKRLEARKQGQVAKSPDLAQAVVFLAVVCWIHFALSSGDVFNQLLGDFQTAFSFNPHATVMDVAATGIVARTGLLWFARLAIPALLLAAATATLVNVLQVGLYFTPQALLPKFERINPAEGLKRMLSMHGTVEVIKGLLKMTLLGYICYREINGSVPDVIAASQANLASLLTVIGGVIWRAGIKVACVLFALAVADYIFKRYEYEKMMRMSHQELKQEIKRTEGDPLVRQRIRKLQRLVSQRRMMAKVPKADVVITNPTHFAVALQYDSKTMKAPTVVAKGQDLIAAKIKEIALENAVPIVENKPLARTLYAQVDLDREIPADLYQAVAEVLSFVYKMHSKAAKKRTGRPSA